MNTLPQPSERHPVLGHLPRWGEQPLELLEEGATLARAHGKGAFGLQLGRAAVVGFSPEWNKRLLGDLSTFRSGGSFSAAVPYLAGGVILTEAPRHAKKRAVLNRGFGKKALAEIRLQMRLALPPFPSGPFDALEWADDAVRKLLNAAYFSGECDEALLRAFLAPLRQPLPAPLLPRPLLFARFERELKRLAASRKRHPRNDLLSFLLKTEDGLTEARVSLAAAHDTTTHTLAYALWYAAALPEWHTPEGHPPLLKEVLRLYPAGWMGSRRVANDTEADGIFLKKGTLALYSPYLSGRDPLRWHEPLTFAPERWKDVPPAWSHLPFGGGERSCLGMHLAQMLILDVLAAMPSLQVHWGRHAPKPALTLGPTGPLVIGRKGEQNGF